VDATVLRFGKDIKKRGGIYLMATSSNSVLKDYMHYIIALVVGILIMLLVPAGDNLTAQGVLILGIVIPILYLWVTGADLTWTSLLFLGLVVITRTMAHADVWRAALGDFVVILVMVFLILDGCLNETGAIKKIANWFITRKFVQGRPYAFLCMFFGANLFIGLWMQNLALAIMYLALTKKLCDIIGLEKKATPSTRS
jgi:sodium-dependent dicarboxylate transporter 2/3/5